jgi:isohexenylglutaconyl-CoA hydratase
LGPGFVEHWTLNDPASRNALSADSVGALRAACQRARHDTALRGVVLQGAGGSFCAGGSLGGFARSIGQALTEGNADPLVPMNRDFGHLLQELAALPQWLLAAVDGAAMGGGIGLVCCADWVVATSRAVFATPEVTMGIVPAQIAPFVMRRLGDLNGRRWLLSGARFNAAQALEQGLVTEVVQDLDAALLERIGTLSRSVPMALAATKQLLADGSEQALPRLLDQAALAFASALRGPEAGRGLKAFADKAAPPWSRT